MSSLLADGGCCCHIPAVPLTHKAPTFLCNLSHWCPALGQGPEQSREFLCCKEKPPHPPLPSCCLQGCAALG